MRILLADPPWYTLQNIRASTLSLGLASLAGVLESEGHSVFIWNGDIYGSCGRGKENVLNSPIEHTEAYVHHSAYEKFRAVLREVSPDIVGITSMTADFHSAQILAAITRESAGNARIIIGGVHATLVPEEVIQDRNFDFLVQGEGEETILELVKCIEMPDKYPVNTIKGIAYRDNEDIIVNPIRKYISDLDSLPLPSYKGLIDRDKHLPVDLGGVITSRGCPYLCTYCASNKLWSRKVRYRTIENVLKEIDKLYDIGVRVFRINDDAFTIQKERAVRFCSGISKYTDVRWSCDTRLELLDKELLKSMRSAGCYQINVGVESGSPRIQELINKKIDLAKARAIIKSAQKTGIRVTAYFMLGFPDETREEMEMTINAASKLKPDYPLFSTLTPYPGTEMRDLLILENKLSNPNSYSSYYHHSREMNYSLLNQDEFSGILNNIDRVNRRRILFRAAVRLISHPQIFYSDRRIVNSQMRHCVNAQPFGVSF